MPRYKCPYCDYTENDKRKVITHVYMTVDDKHGKFRKAPDGFSSDMVIELDKGGDNMGGNQPTFDEEKLRELERLSQENDSDETQSVVEESYTVTESESDELEVRLKKLSESTMPISSELNDIRNTIDDLNDRLTEVERKLEVLRKAILDILKVLGV